MIQCPKMTSLPSFWFIRITIQIIQIYACYYKLTYEKKLNMRISYFWIFSFQIGSKQQSQTKKIC